MWTKDSAWSCDDCLYKIVFHQMPTHMMQYTWKFINQSTSFLSTLESKMSTSSGIVSVVILNHQKVTNRQDGCRYKERNSEYEEMIKTTLYPIILFKPTLLITCSQPFLNLFKNFFPAKSFLFKLSNLKLNLLKDISRVHSSCIRADDTDNQDSQCKQYQ